MKRCGQALIVLLILSGEAWAVSPAEQRQVDKAKEQLDKYRGDVAKNAADTDAALLAEIAAAEQGEVNQRLKSGFSRKIVSEKVVYEFQNTGFQVQKVKELQEKLAALQKRGKMGQRPARGQPLPSPILNVMQLKKGNLGHIEFDTPTQRLGEIKAVPVDAETVTLSLTIERRFDTPERDRQGKPTIRTEWKAVGIVGVVCGGVDPANKNWKVPVFVVVGKQSVGGKSMTKLVQIDTGTTPQ